MTRRKNKGGFVSDTTDVNKNKDYLQPIYDTTATIGIVYSVMSTIIGTIIFVIIIIIGVYVKNMNSDKTEIAFGIVKEVNNCNARSKSCVSVVEFSVKDAIYTVNTESGILSKGQKIKIYYNPENPNNISLNNYTNFIGWIIIIISVIIIVCMWIWTLLTIIYKPIAAASGVGAVTSTASYGIGEVMDEF